MAPNKQKVKNMNFQRKTKIVATLGPASSSKETIQELIEAGVNIFRLNASHGTLEEHKETIEVIKKLRKKLTKKPIAILLDLQGPKIRVGKLENGEPIDLIEGNNITITSDNIIGNQEKISTNYPDLASDINIGDTILLNDGVFELSVIDIKGKDVLTEVKAGGKLSEHKGVNLPGRTNSLSAITEKDKTDLEFAVNNKVDYIALSFVRKEEDIIELKKHIKDLDSSIPVVAKIEKPEALDNISGIIKESDGIMVARGDLGIELAPHKVPMAQKKLIDLANKSKIFVITATQMLESMISSPLPTRAEASDVANAIIDGTDCIMLSGETSIGKYPIKAVKMMDKIACEIELKDYSAIKKTIPDCDPEFPKDSNAIAESAFNLSNELNLAAIIAFTNSGFTAKLISNFRPKVPIIAVTHSKRVSRQLTAYSGVYPFVYDIDYFSEPMLKGLNKFLQEHTVLEKGDKTILVGGIPYLITGFTNLIRIHTI